MTDAKPPQFSLWTLLVVVTFCAIGLAVTKSLGLKVILGCSGFVYSCGLVLLLAAVLIPFDSRVSHLGKWAALLFTFALFCVLEAAFPLLDAAINQPHPVRVDDPPQGTYAWLGNAVAGAAFVAPIAAMVLMLPIAAHLESRSGGPEDHAYYPQLANILRGLCLIRVRMILLIGGLLVFTYYAATTIHVQAAQRHCGIVFPESRVWMSCQLLWGVLWVADGASRVNRGMLQVAIAYLCISAALVALMSAPEIGV